MQRLAAAPELGVGSDLLQAGQAGLTHRLGRRGVAGEDHGGGAVVPEMTEALGVAGHGGMKEFTDLTLEYSVLVDQVAAVAAEELDGEVVVGPGRFGEAEALGGGAEDGGQVGVVGFVAGVGGLAILLGGAGMDEARLVA